MKGTTNPFLDTNPSVSKEVLGIELKIREDLRMMFYPLREILETEDKFREGLKKYIEFLKVYQTKITSKNQEIDVKKLIRELEKLSKEISVLEKYRTKIKKGTILPHEIVNLLETLAGTEETEGELIRRYDSFISLSRLSKTYLEVLNKFVIEEKEVKIGGKILGEIEIMGYIISPIQRPPRYQLIIEQLVNRSGRSLEDPRIREIHSVSEKFLKIIIEKNKQVNCAEQKIAPIELTQLNDLSDKEKKENRFLPKDLFENLCDRFHVKEFTNENVEENIFNLFLDRIKTMLEEEKPKNALFINVKSKLLIHILEERYKAGKLSPEKLEERKSEIRSLVFQKRLSHRSVRGCETESIVKNINSYFNNINYRKESEIKPQIGEVERRLAEAEDFATQKNIRNLDQVKTMLTTFRDSIMSFFQPIHSPTGRPDSKSTPPPSPRS